MRSGLHTMIVATMLLAAGGIGVAPAIAQQGDPEVPQNLGADWEITAKSKKSVERGLAWLAKRQNDDGSFGSQGGYSAHAGITALAGLAFLADGNAPGRGKYGQNVERALEFVLNNTSESSGLVAGPDVSHGPMYGHGFATLFLAEVYGMSPRPEVREKLRLAIRLIVNTQNEQGGWRYQPLPNDADISVTICQTMALRAARNAGIKVPKDTIDRAIKYVRESQNSDGGFSYTLSTRGAGMGSSAFPRSAAGVASLYYSGVYTGKEIDNGLKYLTAESKKQKGSANTFGHFYYGQYYAVQAFFLAGGQHWRDWFPRNRDALIAMQQGDGSWSDGVGAEYATAMALIILQVPNRYLPILER